MLTSQCTAEVLNFRLTFYSRPTNRRSATETNERYLNSRIPSVNTCRLLGSWHNNNADIPNSILCLLWKCEQWNASRRIRNRSRKRTRGTRRITADVVVGAPCGLALVNDRHFLKRSLIKTFRYEYFENDSWGIRGWGKASWALNFALLLARTIIFNFIRLD